MKACICIFLLLCTPFPLSSTKNEQERLIPSSQIINYSEWTLTKIYTQNGIRIEEYHSINTDEKKSSKTHYFLDFLASLCCPASKSNQKPQYDYRYMNQTNTMQRFYR